MEHASNKKRRISGSLNWMTGAFHARQLSKFGVKQLLSYYQELETVYPDVETIYLVQDYRAVHRHPDLLGYFQASRITPLWLPIYPPWTNPTEKVWLRLEQKVLHLHPFEDDWQGLQQPVDQCLNQ